MKHAVISGELVVQRKLRSVSLQGEKKKRSEMVIGRKYWMELVGGGGDRWL